MKLKSHIIALLIIFLLVFSARAYISLKTNQFSDDDSYFALRQIENIKNTGKVIFEDDLSYGGRTYMFFPIFYYILGLVYFIVPSVISLKIFLNLMASLIVIGAYFISLELTKNKNISFLTALVSGFIPIYFKETVNTLSIFSIYVPLVFCAVYYMIKINKDKSYSTYFILVMAILILLSPLSIILILGFMLFLILSRLEKLKFAKFNLEIIIVSTFFYLWFNFILYKKAILFHGFKVIWQNVPKEDLIQYFSQVSIIDAVYQIGIIPFFLGIYASYAYTTKQRSLQTYIIVGIVLSLFFLLWFKLIPLITGLIFLGSILTLMLSKSLRLLYDYANKTKLSKYNILAIIAVLLIVVFTSIVPAFTLGLKTLDNAPSKEVIDAYNWLENNSGNDSIILASKDQGHALTYFTGRRNLIDNNFLFIKDIDQRVYDIRRIYITKFSAELLELAKKYDINYIIVDDNARQLYNIEDLGVSSDCINLAYDNNVKIYEVACYE